MDHFVFAVVAVVFLAPVVIYVIDKLDPRLSRFSYAVLGSFCLVIAVAFFAFVGWSFVETGDLVSPGKYRPSMIIDSSAPTAVRIYVGAFNIGIGLTLAVVGVGLLRVSRKK